ncbi:hypothetical protein DE146DRAFT_122734 [Phaeosphaeria sp. MPI-PUGE-AT-0046c]|nr:hypothetical protein DE146DRAFT_122734 [Phaeosphaeria sp. MPI-PUGE-AT-0046c]
MEDAQHVFESSLEAIRNTLSSSDLASFRAYGDPKKMMVEVQKGSKNYANRSKLVACCKKIEIFADAFAPYFDVIGIFVQIKPEWAGWFWGVFRLILQLGDNLASFLENVANMFENLSFRLPQFQAWYELCRKNLRTCDKSRLGHALSFIYTDVIQFCLHVYRIFNRTTKNSGLLTRARSAAELLWKPFQHHFSDVIINLEKHQAWFETEALIHQHATITEHFDSFQDFLKSTETQDAREKIRERAMQEKEYAHNVRLLKNWIDGPLYRDVYERTRRDRLPGSGKDFLLDQRYLEWRDSGFQNSTQASKPYSLDAHLERILFVQAKPGYGKTYLSGIVIDDLLETTSDISQSDAQKPRVVFYHFTSANKWSSDRPEDALRSITSQLLVLHSQDRYTIDALVLLLNETGSGQRLASVDDILSSLALLLRRHPTYIIIDAMDECVEPDTFKRHFLEITKAHDCRALLLGRPTTPFPACSCYRLRGVLNRKDIERLLATNFETMSKAGLFGSLSQQEISVDRYAQSITRHSSGMFLWARLFLNYLCSPALTPRQRLHSLQHPSAFVGIDTLYDSILSLIKGSGEHNAKVAEDVIAWLSGALYPLSEVVLHTALAITPGEATHSHDYLIDYPDCISRITCALVETTGAGEVGFIHLSFKEYLEARISSAQPLPLGGLDGWPSIHLNLATKCLSYLANDVPSQPLQPLEIQQRRYGRRPVEAAASTLQASNQETTTVTRGYILDSLRSRYPLLRYAALAWSTHIEYAHKYNNYRYKGTGDERVTSFAESWINLLAAFLVDRQTVTMWVEACCIYDLTPKLQTTAKALGYLRHYGSRNTMEGREMMWVAAGMQQLAGALDYLLERYPQVTQDSSLIWTPFITDAHEKNYWPDWEDEDSEYSGDGRGPRPIGQADFRPDPGELPSRSRSFIPPYVR